MKFNDVKYFANILEKALTKVIYEQYGNDVYTQVDSIEFDLTMNEEDDFDNPWINVIISYGRLEDSTLFQFHHKVKIKVLFSEINQYTLYGYLQHVVEKVDETDDQIEILK